MNNGNLREPREPMSKKGLITLRNTTEDAEVKAALRWAINRIEKLEAAMRECSTYSKAIERAVKDI